MDPFFLPETRLEVNKVESAILFTTFMEILA